MKREGYLIAQECDWNEFIRKSAYFHSFGIPSQDSLLAVFPREMQQRGHNERRGEGMVDYLVPQGSCNFATTTMSMSTTTTIRSQFKAVIFALMHTDKRFFFNELLRKGIILFFSFVQSVVTPMIFLLHTTLPLAAVAAGLRHVILWQSD